MKRLPLILLTCVCLLGAAPPVSAPFGFSPAEREKQRALEARFAELLSAERIREHMHFLASKPHFAGSAATRENAFYLRDRLRDYGFEAEVVPYEMYLPAVQRVAARLVVPVEQELRLTEDVVPGDPYSEHAAEHPGWNGYSASGDVTGEVVYARQGTAEDFAQLEQRGIDLRGKIVLMRYFGAGEGRKVRRAEARGAAGVILYADPAEDGFVWGDPYPKGNWRPPGSIMRRTIIDTPHEGDPLTPGVAARPGAKRLDPAAVEGIPKIPVLPVSYRDAETILRHLQGPVAPPGWRGALALTYHVGPGPARVRLRVEADNRDATIYNVIARLRGRDFPDEWVLAGNHHDAWIFGAGDPASGTAAFLEMARAIGELARAGQGPRRTLVFGIWDAEELNLGGVSEWVEEHAAELRQHGIAYINMDSAVFNPDRPLFVSASGSLRRLFWEASQAVPDPRTGRPTYDVWLEMQNRFREVPSVDGRPEFFDPSVALARPEIDNTPLGDDQTAFYVHAALPASDMYYGSDYGTYHSLYENIHWMETIVDPGYRYHRMMAHLHGLLVLRLANADLLPLDLTEMVADWEQAVASLDRLAQAKNWADISEVSRLVKEWRKEAERVELARIGSLAVGNQGTDVAEANRLLAEVGRAFFQPEGLPGLPWYRNLFAAPVYFEGDRGSTLPGLRWAIQRNNRAEFEAQRAIYLRALRNVIATTRALANRLSAQAQPRTPSR